VSTAPAAVPSRPFLNDWPLFMAINVVLVLLAGVQVRNSLAELQGYKRTVTDLNVNRFRATQEYQQMESIFTGLISLAEKDGDARRIVDKFQIAARDELENAALGNVPTNFLP